MPGVIDIVSSVLAIGVMTLPSQKHRSTGTAFVPTNDMAARAVACDLLAGVLRRHSRANDRF